MSQSEYERTVAQCYSTWGKSYYEDYYGPKASYPPVHRELLRKLLKAHRVRRVLDVGCGPASFLRDVAGEGLELYGFDLTPEMVAEAKSVFASKGLPPANIWQGSVLDANSFRAPGGEPGSFDAAVCVGVLPHIAAEDESKVILNLASAVRPGGLVALEARNQFFALFTLNRYSFEFFADELVNARRLGDRTPSASASLRAVLDEMKKQFRMDLPPIRKGTQGEPGYDQVLSRTHNPLVLKKSFESAGFVDVELKFYHYHCLPPMLGATMPELFLNESLAMEDPDDWRGYFMASAFFAVGKRK